MKFYNYALDLYKNKGSERKGRALNDPIVWKYKYVVVGRRFRFNIGYIKISNE